VVVLKLRAVPKSTVRGFIDDEERQATRLDEVRIYLSLSRCLSLALSLGGGSLRSRPLGTTRYASPEREREGGREGEKEREREVLSGVTTPCRMTGVWGYNPV